MKTLLLTICSLAIASAAEPAKPLPPLDPAGLSDAQARKVREAQLGAAVAIITALRAQKAADDAQAQLVSMVAALEKAAPCLGCTLGDDLLWKRPLAPVPAPAKAAQ